MRTVGKFGALPRDFSMPFLTFEHYITRVSMLPAAPLMVDRMLKVANYPMYLNDQLGNCTSAGMLHALSALTAYSGRVPGGALFTDGEALKLYEHTGGYVPGNPFTDNGATLQSVAQYMVDTGVTDVAGHRHKLAAWANVGDPTNQSLLKKILYTFGTVYCAVDIPQSAEDQFTEGKPWVPVKGSPVMGAHCVPLQFSAFGMAGTNHRAQTFISWGAAQPASIDWIAEYITEALVLVSPDWLNSHGSTIDGLNMNQLLGDMADV